MGLRWVGTALNGRRFRGPLNIESRFVLPHKRLLILFAPCLFLLAAECGGGSTSSVACENQWLVASFQGTLQSQTSSTQIVLRDSVELAEIGATTFHFLKDVFIAGRTASGASAIWDVGFTAANGRLDLMISGSRAIGSNLPIVGVFSPPGWYQGPIVSAVFPDAARIFFRLPGSESASEANGQFNVTGLAPLKGHISATVGFPTQSAATLTGEVELRGSNNPSGCTPS